MGFFPNYSFEKTSADYFQKTLYNLVMDAIIDNFLKDYFSLEIIPGKKVRIPYWRNRITHRGLCRIQGSFGGKGAPSQIKRATIDRAKKSGIDINKLTSVQIRKFMTQKRIGLDCSGFVFQVLDFLFPGFWQGLKRAFGKSSNPIRRFNSDALTSKENTILIKKVEDIKVGDLIPISWQGKKVDHVLVVVEINKKEIVYAHSSQKTKITGPHKGKIKITDLKKGLDKQSWQEKNLDGKLISGFLTSPKARRIKND